MSHQGECKGTKRKMLSEKGRMGEWNNTEERWEE